MFEVHYFLRWVLPVLLYQTFARTLGDGKHRKQARLLVKLEKKLSKFTQTFRHFTGNNCSSKLDWPFIYFSCFKLENQWVFSVNNSEDLIRWMSKEEQEEFNFDASTYFSLYLVMQGKNIYFSIKRESGLDRLFITVLLWTANVRVEGKGTQTTQTRGLF